MPLGGRRGLEGDVGDGRCVREVPVTVCAVEGSYALGRSFSVFMWDGRDGGGRSGSLGATVVDVVAKTTMI